MKKHRNKIIAAVLIALSLAIAYFWSGSVPDYGKKNGLETSISEQKKTADKQKHTKKNTALSKEKSGETHLTAEEKVQLAEKIAKENGVAENEHTENDKTNVPAENTAPEEKNNADPDKGEYTCTLSVRCDTVLNNMEYLKEEKRSIIPKDGVVFGEKEVVFYDGESVFNLLLREMKKNKIHMEFVNTPVYKTAYIEGIANIYELDCGELSGWMYKVNGIFPNYGCSRYKLKEGDKVEWVYTCNLGIDVGGYFADGGSQRDE